MTILAFFASLVGLDADALRNGINAAIAAAPDGAPFLAMLLGRLDEAVSAESLTQLAGAMPMELKELALLHLNPKRHPSDF